MAMVTHCIFDMDGLILDTEQLYEKTIQQILDRYGKTYTWEVKMTIMGLRHMEMCKRLVEAFELPLTLEEFSKILSELNSEVMKEAKLMPGAKRLLRHLYSHKIPFCLATSSRNEMIEIKITNHREIFQLFQHCVSGSSDPEVKRGKPAPDIFLMAASRFPDKPDPSKCLVFEDAPNGLQAAHIAGMQVVIVPDVRVSFEMCALATQRLKSFEEFKPELFGLPPFEA